MCVRKPCFAVLGIVKIICYARIPTTESFSVCVVILDSIIGGNFATAGLRYSVIQNLNPDPLIGIIFDLVRQSFDFLNGQRHLVSALLFQGIDCTNYGHNADGMKIVPQKRLQILDLVCSRSIFSSSRSLPYEHCTEQHGWLYSPFGQDEHGSYIRSHSFRTVLKMGSAKQINPLLTYLPICFGS